MDARAHDYRFVVGADLVLGYSEVDAYGDPAAAGTAPTISVTRLSDGAAVAATVAAPLDSDAAQTYTATIAAAANTAVDVLVAVWTSGDSGVTRTETVNVVSRAYFPLDLAGEAGFRISGDLSVERRRWARLNAEHEAELITGRAFVPQFRQDLDVIGSGSAEQLFPVAPVASLLAVVELDSDGITDTTWTAGELANVDLGGTSGIVRRFGDTWAPVRHRINYLHGYGAPPPDIVEAVMRRYVHYLSKPGSGVADRALSYTTEDGVSYRLSIPSRERTGDPEVDAIYARYRLPSFL